MKNYTKAIIIFVSILIIYAVVVLIFYKPGSKPVNPNDNTTPVLIPSEANKTKYLLVDNVSVWSYADSRWAISNYEAADNKQFKVFIDDEYVNTYILKHGKQWNFFDISNNYINNEKYFIAASTNMDIETIKPELEGITEEELARANRIFDTNIIMEAVKSSYVASVDLNNDKQADKLVLISTLNYDFVEKESDYYYNLVYAVIDGNTYTIIEEEIPVADKLMMPVYQISSIINVNNKSNNSIIIRKVYFSVAADVGYIMYDLSQGKYSVTVEDPQM